MSKLNICVIGLTRDFTDSVCMNISNKLDLYYANVEKILDFELFDHENIEKLCGKEYLQREERSIIKRLCTYEDTLINLNYFNINHNDILEYIKEHCLLIYLHITKERGLAEILNSKNSVLDEALFIDRDKICAHEADIVIDCKEYSVEDISDITTQEIIKYFS